MSEAGEHGDRSARQALLCEGYSTAVDNLGGGRDSHS